MGTKKIINKTQRIVLAIGVPIILLAIFIGMSGSYVDSCGIWYDHGWSPFFLEHSWWIWLFYVIIISVFEFLLFRTKEDKKE